MRGSKGDRLLAMQKAAWEANKGRPRSEDTKLKISETRKLKRIQSGAKCSEVFGFPLYIKQNRWYFFSNGKHIVHARAVYEKFYGNLLNGHVIHHIDGDSFNDDISNSRKEHYYLHLYWDVVNHWTGDKASGFEILEKYKQWRRREGYNFSRG